MDAYFRVCVIFATRSRKSLTDITYWLWGSQIYNVEIIKNAFKGIDHLGIVPDTVLPIECSGFFHKYKPTEFIHLNSNMYKYIEWEPLENIELKK